MISRRKTLAVLAILLAGAGWLAWVARPGSSVRAAADGGAIAYLPALLRNWPPPPGPLYLPHIASHWPPASADLTVSRVEVIQGITLSQPYRVYVAGRPALVRVFVNVTGAGSVAGVSARLTRYLGGAPQDSLLAGPITAVASPNEGSLAETINFDLPSAWLEAGAAYVLDLDPANAVDETDETNNRYPAAGTQPFNFAGAPTLEVVIVPVVYARPGAPVTQPDTSNLDYLTWMPFRVYPVSQIVYTVRSAPLQFTGDLRTGSGWNALLNSVTSVHNAEEPQQRRVYFALVDSVAADGCSGGCIAGIGWVNDPGGFVLKSSAGFAGFPSSRGTASPTFTHEMGHNFGRYHSPCGTTNGLGPYPYGSGARIGQWGYDLVTGTLYNPDTYRDYMSYCSPEWTSDFTYFSLFQAWDWISNPLADVAGLEEGDALLVTGVVSPDGTVDVGWAFRGPALQPEVAGGNRVRVELLDEAGAVLADVAAGATHVALDSTRTGQDNYLGFRAALPDTIGAAALRVLLDGNVLYERRVSGPAPLLGDALTGDSAGAQVSWLIAASAQDLHYRVSLSSDGGQTWQLVSDAAVEPAFQLPADWLARATELMIQVQASDGVRVDVKVYALPPAGR